MKTIYITKKSGHISNYQAHLDAILSMLPNGRHELNITRSTNRRTHSQNALFWLWAEYIAQETGSTREDIHDYYCEKYLRRPVEINGQTITVTGGTRKLTKDAFSEFLDKMRAEVEQQVGITLPQPEDPCFRDFQAYYTQFINH